MEDKVLATLQKVGAFRAGHFVFTSGLHADTYVNKDAIYPYTKETSELCRAIAEHFKDSGVEVVIGPAIAAAILAQWTAHHLSDFTGRDVKAAYADKDLPAGRQVGEGGFIIKRGYDQVVKGKKTLVVEDLTTTGGSIRKVVEAARTAGADVVGASAICNRGNVSREAVGNPPEFFSLLNVQLDQWSEGDCDLCKRGIPVNVEVGHGREYLAKKTA